MEITPNTALIVRSKQKFFWIALILLLINIYLVATYTNIPEGEAFSGQVILVLTFFNFPLLLLTLLIASAPLLYRKRFSTISYKVTSTAIQIFNPDLIKQIELADITAVESIHHKVVLFYDNSKKRYDLEGLSSTQIEQLLTLL